MPFGLPFGTAMTSWFFTNVTGSPAASPASVTVFMVAGLAAANTSAGAPEMICCARPELPPNEKVTVVPGLAASKSLPIWVNVSVSEAAASTVTGPPERAAAATGLRGRRGVAARRRARQRSRRT